MSIRWHDLMDNIYAPIYVIVIVGFLLACFAQGGG